MSSSEQEEKNALARAARGDKRAFAVVVRAYGKALAKLAGSYGVTPGDIEDVVQDAFIAAWRALADFDQTKPFRGWLFQILLNKARDWRRRRQVRSIFFRAEPLDEAVAVALAEPGAEERMHDRQMLDRVSRALAALPDHLRRPLLLIAVAGMSRGEAAASLGLTLKALDGRVDRARAQVQELIAGQVN